MQQVLQAHIVAMYLEPLRKMAELANANLISENNQSQS